MIVSVFSANLKGTRLPGLKVRMMRRKMIDFLVIFALVYIFGVFIMVVYDLEKLLGEIKRK